MHYDSLKEEMFKIPERLDMLVVEQREKVEKLDFYDEETFNEYLNELQTLKKLENQKKFVNYWSIIYKILYVIAILVH